MTGVGSNPVKCPPNFEWNKKKSSMCYADKNDKMFIKFILINEIKLSILYILNMNTIFKYNFSFSKWTKMRFNLATYLTLVTDNVQKFSKIQFYGGKGKKFKFCWEVSLAKISEARK